MSENVIQASFASGELSPSLFARVDISKYHSGAATMRNFFVDYRSGASTRPGTEFIQPCTGMNQVRLVRFQQSVDVTYVLVFEDGKLRFIADGGSVVETAFTITAVVLGTATDFTTSPPHNFAIGDLVFVSGNLGLSQANDRYFLVGSTLGNQFKAVDPFTGAEVDSTTWDPLISGGIVARVFTINTPWPATALSKLKFSQRANTMNITSTVIGPYILTLFSATNWTLVPAVFGATIAAPGISSVTATSLGPASYNFLVTAIDPTGQESGPSNPGPIVGVLDLRNTAGSIEVFWTTVGGATGYNVYCTSPSYLGDPGTSVIHGFVGTVNAPGLQFVNSNITPDFSASPPIHNDPLISIGPIPQVSAYFQQRLVYANFGGADVDRFTMSKPGAYYNFDISNPSESDDSVDARLVSLEVNEIKSMIPMPSGLVMLTTKGAWQVSGGAGGVATQGGPITPTSLTATAQAYIGANDVPPILINYDILYVQQKGSIVRDLTYNIYANIYTGNDISIMSSHLFYGHQVVEWAYAEEPFKIVWVVRDDGALLSLTAIREQEMYGWARHDTLGNFKSICTVTEGAVDAAYVVVDRPKPNGTFIKMIERIHERTFPFGAEDAWSSDAAVQNAHQFPNADLTIVLGAQGNVVGGPVGFSTSAAVVASNQVGFILRAGGGRVTITAVTSNFTFTGTILSPFTNLLPDDPINRPNIVLNGNWTLDALFTTIHGLSHLEGQKVSVLADGGVVNGLTVFNAGITLPSPASKVTVGLGFQAQLQTMPLDLGQETNTIQGKRKKIGALTVRVKDSRGIKAGRTFKHLVPIKELNQVTQLNQPVMLVTADERIIMDPLWDVPGQVCLQVDDPLPATVLGVIPEVVIGDTPK